MRVDAAQGQRRAVVLRDPALAHPLGLHGADVDDGEAAAGRLGERAGASLGAERATDALGLEKEEEDAEAVRAGERRNAAPTRPADSAIATKPTMSALATSSAASASVVNATPRVSAALANRARCANDPVHERLYSTSTVGTNAARATR